MGEIKETTTGRRQVLESEHLVGRAPSCTLRLAPRYVSTHHAILRFAGERWELRDLGSRNGTFVDGVAVESGGQVWVKKGSRIAFGKAEEEWEMSDDSAPSVMVIPLPGGPPVLIEGEILALPSAEDPQLTIYRNADGVWIVEQTEVSLAIENLQTFEFNGQHFRFSCPEHSYRTSLLAPTASLEVQHLSLQFSVSRDEEHVHLRVTSGASSFDLGSHSFHYLLLTLARRRIADAAAGLPETSCGWIYLEDIAHDPTMAPPQLNIDVFRIRKQFEAIRVVDPACIVERRPRTKQLRLGVASVSVALL